MRVYFAGADGLNGCYHVRCLLPLVANGFDGDRTSINPDFKTPENKTKAALASDVVVFHRPETPQKLELARLLKKQGKKIVFDNDDTYKDHDSVKLNKYITEERLKRGLKSLNKYVDQFIIEADLVTASTEFLAEEYRKLNPNVAVLPNCIDPFYFDEPLRNETDKIRIGIVGSVGSTSDMLIGAPIVAHYEKDPRVTMVFFSLPGNRHDKLVSEVYTDEYAWLDSVNVEWNAYVDMDKYYDKLNSLKLDIMIIPREDNYFNKCKSNLKFLEASLFEIPVIAQGFSDGLSPYQVNPKDAEQMVIVTEGLEAHAIGNGPWTYPTNTELWIREIEKMIADKEGRREMGRKAREYVLENYDIQLHAHKWKEVYEKLQ